MVVSLIVRCHESQHISRGEAAVVGDVRSEARAVGWKEPHDARDQRNYSQKNQTREKGILFYKLLIIQRLE
jgi:hypothetical protein